MRRNGKKLFNRNTLKIMQLTTTTMNGILSFKLSHFPRKIRSCSSVKLFFQLTFLFSFETNSILTNFHIFQQWNVIRHKKNRKNACLQKTWIIKKFYLYFVLLPDSNLLRLATPTTYTTNIQYTSCCSWRLLLLTWKHFSSSWITRLKLRDSRSGIPETFFGEYVKSWYTGWAQMNGPPSEKFDQYKHVFFMLSALFVKKSKKLTKKMNLSLTLLRLIKCKYIMSL